MKKDDSEIRRDVQEAAESYLKSLIGKSQQPYSDPFESPEDLEKYVDAFLNYLKSSPALSSLMVGQFEIGVSDARNYAIRFNPSTGKTNILMPSVQNETTEQKESREARLLAAITSRSGTNLVESILDLIRGMKDEFRVKLLEDFSHKSEKRGGSHGDEKNSAG